MSSRLFWFATGAGAALYGTVRARRLAYRLTPQGLTDQLATAAIGAREMLAEVRLGMVEREAEIARDLGLAERNVTTLASGHAADAARALGPASRPVAPATGPWALAPPPADR